jgi:hypothetical protein
MTTLSPSMIFRPGPFGLFPLTGPIIMKVDVDRSPRSAQRATQLKVSLVGHWEDSLLYGFKTWSLESNCSLNTIHEDFDLEITWVGQDSGGDEKRGKRAESINRLHIMSAASHR